MKENAPSRSIKFLSQVILLLLFLPLMAVAQVRITVQAPSEVVQGDRFRVSYVVNTSET